MDIGKKNFGVLGQTDLPILYQIFIDIYIQYLIQITILQIITIHYHNTIQRSTKIEKHTKYLYYGQNDV